MFVTAYTRAMNDKALEERLIKLTQTQTKFVDVANQLSQAQQTKVGVCGSWSPKDVVAHLVGWDASLKQLIVDIENFVPPYDVHQFNEQSVAVRQALSWQDVLTELQTNFAELQTAVPTVTQEMKIYGRVKDWLSGRIADYELHTGQFEAWLE